MDKRLLADIDKLHAMITPEMREAADPSFYAIKRNLEEFVKVTRGTLYTSEEMITAVNKTMRLGAVLEKSVLFDGWGIQIVADADRIKFLVDSGMPHEDAYREAFFEEAERILQKTINTA